jgi:hypothetical protein
MSHLSDYCALVTTGFARSEDDLDLDTREQWVRELVATASRDGLVVRARADVETAGGAAKGCGFSWPVAVVELTSPTGESYPEDLAAWGPYDALRELIDRDWPVLLPLLRQRIADELAAAAEPDLTPTSGGLGAGTPSDAALS